MSLEDRLFECCADGDTEEIEKIISRRKFLFFYSVRVNCRNSDNNTPLFVATQHGQLEAVRILLFNSADPNHRNQSDMTALMLAAAMGRSDIVELLLNYSADPRGVDVDLKMKSGTTALYLAAEKGDEESLALLIERGAAVDIPIEDSSTALYIAAQNGFPRIVGILLKAGANIDVALRDNSTPLFSAAFRGHLQVVKVLIKEGAATDIVLSNGASILDVASTDEIRDAVSGIQSESEEIEEAGGSDFAEDSGLFVDTRDGNEYRWIRIGSNIWMADNLRYRSEQFCWPSEDVAQTGCFYGRSVMPAACPNGWRLPEKSDFEELVDHFGGEDKAFACLLSSGDSGFNAVQAGRRYDDGEITNTDSAYFWALSLDEDGLAWFLRLAEHDEQAVLIETWDESLKINMGASVRCIKQQNAS